MTSLTLVVSLLAGHVPHHHELSLSADGAVTAGLPVGGYAGGTFRYQYRFDSGIFLGALAGLSAGLGLIDPRLAFVAGANVIDARRVSWQLMLYTGWPLVGVQTKLEVYPLRFEHFEASLGLRGSGELLFNAEGDAFVRFAFPAGGWVPSVRVALEAGAGVRSGAHAGASASLQLARRF